MAVSRLLEVHVFTPKEEEGTKWDMRGVEDESSNESRLLAQIKIKEENVSEELIVQNK